MPNLEQITRYRTELQTVLAEMRAHIDAVDSRRDENPEVPGWNEEDTRAYERMQARYSAAEENLQRELDYQAAEQRLGQPANPRDAPSGMTIGDREDHHCLLYTSPSPRDS